MPIPGLNEQQPRFPKIGQIRKGAPKTQDDRPGKDLTYFRYVAIEGEEAAADVFAKVFGSEPREVDVILPFDSVKDNFESYMELHTASALQCRGDIEGGTKFMWRDDSGKMQHGPAPCPAQVCEGCKESGYLKVIIPALRRLAYVEVLTTSKWDIIELTNNLKAIRQMSGNGLKGIPLVLKRRPREVSTPRQGGKRVRQEKWLLSLEMDPRYVETQLDALRLAAMPTLAALPEGEVEDADFDEVTGEIEPEQGFTSQQIARAEAEIDAVAKAEAELGAVNVSDIPTDYGKFVALAVKTFKHIKGGNDVAKALQAQGFDPVCDTDGSCAFDPDTGWAIVEGA